MLPLSLKERWGWSNPQDSDLFNAYLCFVLLPLVAIGAIIIMDNARDHLSEETRDLIEEKGCRLIYLSPYSPKLNRIEKYWGVLKRYIQRFRCLFRHPFLYF